MTHLGNRVSALLDGQLGPEEEERAWQHVHACHACRDLVEREGWVKTRLLGLSLGEESAPSGLKGALVDPTGCVDRRQAGPVEARRYGMVALSGGALGAAFLGVLALTVTPGPGSVSERRAPVTTIATPAARSGSAVGNSVTPVADRVGPHRGRAGVSGVRMVP
ncbi:hypothetical protein K8W59_04340 [Nocardioides rotundus]|uniref:anti-sigma factor family protein n=1 Tax=Nocardioides rotundus TaxID=1774216 RepID=UPI001CC0E7D9|nr:zf-HC2 domain-containing protein [Nocardioides rotundus]UAL30743.1 hypothetical protein K8W59_04340 [Nocardioides rotundus]